MSFAVLIISYLLCENKRFILLLFIFTFYILLLTTQHIRLVKTKVIHAIKLLHVCRKGIIIM